MVYSQAARQPLTHLGQLLHVDKPPVDGEALAAIAVLQLGIIYADHLQRERERERQRGTERERHWVASGFEIGV